MNTHPASEQSTPAGNTPRFLKVADVAKALSVSAMTVYRDIEDGKIPAIQVRGAWRVPASVIDEMVAAALRRQAAARAKAAPRPSNVA